jgi:acyl carrier protein
LDSAAAVGMTGELADWLDHEMDPTLLYDYPTIESLVQYLSVSIG